MMRVMKKIVPGLKGRLRIDGVESVIRISRLKETFYIPM